MYIQFSKEYHIIVIFRSILETNYFIKSAKASQ